MLRRVDGGVARGEAGDAKGEAGVRFVASKPELTPLQPYSPIWTKAAVGIVDDMIRAGEFENAYSSCQSMEKIEQAKGAGVYLRQGLLNFFCRDASSKPSTDRVLELLDDACRSGCQMLPSELASESLHEYFAACSVDVDQRFESLSKSILDNPTQSGKELLLLTALLRLDGQSQRAMIFAKEARQLASKSIEFRWDNLLFVCSE